MAKKTKPRCHCVTGRTGKQVLYICPDCYGTGEKDFAKHNAAPGEKKPR